MVGWEGMPLGRVQFAECVFMLSSRITDYFIVYIYIVKKIRFERDVNLVSSYYSVCKRIAVKLE